MGGFDLRVAIVSDIHGNLTALDAVVADIERREPDAVVHGGDLALSGARPAEVVDRVRELGWPGVVGNTDELLWRPEDRAAQEARAPKLRDLLRILFESHRPATDELLGQHRLEWLSELPRQWRLGALALVHASPGDLWRAPMPGASEEELARVYGELGADVVVYGHIHRPYVRKLGELTVANSGSVGMPGDGDWRASYLLLDEGLPSVRRVEYDLERELAVLERSGYPHADWIAERLRSGRFVRPPGRLP